MKWNIILLMMTGLLFAKNLFSGIWTGIPLEKDADTIPADILHARREAVLKKIKGDHAFISSDDTSDFYYLTGIRHTQAAALIRAGHDRNMVLFLNNRTPHQLLWQGPALTQEDAVRLFQADTVVSFSHLEKFIKSNVREKSRISVCSKENHWSEWMKQQNYKIDTDLKNIVHEMRVLKDDWEKDQIQKAVDVTVLAHQRVLNTLKKSRYEYHVRAEIEYVYHQHHCEAAFPSITGSGNNACYLHYEDYGAPLVEDNLILVDIGAKYNGYCGDVTRTYPVSGRFTDRQKELYLIVYRALKAGLQKMSPSHHFFDGHMAATSEIVRGLYQLGLITDTTSTWQKLFYIHYRNSHYLGADVHDVGYYGKVSNINDLVNSKHRGRKLQPGMILTMEPGIYLMKERIEQLNELFPHVPRKELESFYTNVSPVYARYAGIGIRLEEDVYITTTGHEVMSSGAPLSIEDIEKAINP